MQNVSTKMRVKMMVPVLRLSERKDAWSKKFKNPRNMVKQQNPVSR